MLFTLSIFGVAALLAMLLIYHRSTILPRISPYLPARFRRAGYAPLSTFEDQQRAGLSSSAFDLEQNLAGDSRSGMDERGSEELRNIMRSEGVSFDEARLIRHKRILARNGIDPSGMPLDSKAITRL